MLPWTILQYFWPALSDNWSWKPIFGLFESGHFRQVLLLYLQTAKEAYHSVMIIRPRRPTTEKFIEFEKEIMRRAVDRYDYVWPERSEVSFFIYYIISMLGSRKVHKGLQTTACGNIFVTNLFSPIPDQDFCRLYPYEI